MRVRIPFRPPTKINRGKMTYEEFISTYSHVVFCVTPEGGVLHMVGYEKELTYEDKIELIDELSTDEELGMVGMRYSADYIMMEQSTIAASGAIKAVFEGLGSDDDD